MNYESAIIVGCVKNASAYMDDVFVNIFNISKLYKKVECIFIENDSTDDTKKQIGKWSERGLSVKLISFDGLDAYQPVRTMRLEITRNAYLDQIKNNPKYSGFDHMIVIDMDDKGAYPIQIDSLEKSLHFLMEEPRRAAIFANQRNSYYDLWALRHKSLCPFDFWHEVIRKSIDNPTTNDQPFNEVFNQVVKLIPENNAPIKVESAFGGLGVYKISYVLSNTARYIGYKYKFFNTSGNVFFSKLQTCEHVSFNKGIVSMGGELYIMPSLINSEQQSYINPSAYHSMIIRG